MDIENTTLNTHNGTVNLGDISPVGIAYLLQYGLSKSLQDSVSGNAKVLADAYNTANPDKAQAKALADAFADLGEEPNTSRTTEAFVEAVVKARKDERLAGIVAGTIGQAGPRGPRVSKIKQMMRAVAIERIAARVKTLGKPMPKGDVLKELVNKLIAKTEDSIREEAERRMGAAANLADDLDDLI